MLLSPRPLRLHFWMSAIIRPARAEELPQIQDVLLRSKASWGYDESFMAAARDDLTLAADYVATTHTYVCVDDRVRGFYGLRVHGDDAELVDLFVAPESMGRGIGRALWDHAVALARSLGCRRMRWESDPNAEPFYLRIGAQRTGARESSIIPGRALPLMAIELDHDSRGALSHLNEERT
jgi:GNAT superfamily N-acetyltransferase